MMIYFYVCRLRSVLSFDTLKIGYNIVFLGDMGFAMKNFQVLTMAWLLWSINLMASTDYYAIEVAPQKIFNYEVARDFQVNSPQLQRVVADATFVMHVTFDENQPNCVFRLVYPNAAQEYTSLMQEKREDVYFQMRRLLFLLLPVGSEKMELAQQLNLAYDPENCRNVRESLFGPLDADGDDIMFYNFVLNTFIPEDAVHGPEIFVSGGLIVEPRDDESKNVLQARVDGITERLKKAFQLREFDSFITD